MSNCFEVIAYCCLNLDTLRFRAPFGGLKSTYHRLIEKRVVDIPIVLTVKLLT